MLQYPTNGPLHLGAEHNRPMMRGFVPAANDRALMISRQSNPRGETRRPCTGPLRRGAGARRGVRYCRLAWDGRGVGEVWATFGGGGLPSSLERAGQLP